MRPDSKRVGADTRKLPLQKGAHAFRGPVLGLGKREQTAHEPLNGSVMVVGVLLTGLTVL